VSKLSIDTKELEALSAVLLNIDKPNYQKWVLSKSQTKTYQGKITSLDLSWLGIKYLPEFCFEPLTNLVKIRLDNNPNCTFSENAFGGCISLKEIQMQYCAFKELPSHAIPRNQIIHSLDISHNPLHTNWNQRKNPIHIQQLNLTNTGFDDDYDKFSNIIGIEQLILNNNRITNLQPYFFSDLSSLKILYLNQNHIYKLSKDIFNGLINLRELYLDNNEIEIIQPDSFNSLSHLDKLSMYNNKITSLRNIFFKLQSLRILNLELNLVSSLHHDSFQNNKNLQTINLKLNQITDIEKGTFNQLSQDVLLYFQENPIDINSALRLPSNTLFNYLPLIKKIEPKDLHELIKQNYQNEMFVNQAISSDLLLPKTIAFLRLIGFIALDH